MILSAKYSSTIDWTDKNAKIEKQVHMEQFIQKDTQFLSTSFCCKRKQNCSTNKKNLFKKTDSYQKKSQDQIQKLPLNSKNKARVTGSVKDDKGLQKVKEIPISRLYEIYKQNQFENKILYTLHQKQFVELYKHKHKGWGAFLMMNDFKGATNMIKFINKIQGLPSLSQANSTSHYIDVNTNEEKITIRAYGLNGGGGGYWEDIIQKLENLNLEMERDAFGNINKQILQILQIFGVDKIKNEGNIQIQIKDNLKMLKENIEEEAPKKRKNQIMPLLFKIELKLKKLLEECSFIKNDLQVRITNKEAKQTIEKDPKNKNISKNEIIIENELGSKRTLPKKNESSFIRGEGIDYEMEKKIENRKIQELESLRMDPNFQQVKTMYIPLRCKRTQNSEVSFDLNSRILDFLAKKKERVFLLKGESGMGKSTYTNILHEELLKGCAIKKGELEREGKGEDKNKNKNKNKGEMEGEEKNKGVMGKVEIIPIHVNLISLKKPMENLVEEVLIERWNLSNEEIKEMNKLKKKQILFILDGYDELNIFVNIIQNNKLLDKFWNCKIIITSRTSELPTDYKNCFAPVIKGNESEYDYLALEEWFVAEFRERDIGKYLDNFLVKTPQEERNNWGKAKYQKYIHQIIGLRELIETPYTLLVVTEVLPYIVKKHKEKEQGTQKNKESRLQLTKHRLYTEYINKLLGRQKLKMIEQEIEFKKKTLWNYYKGLAKEMYKQQTTKVIFKKGLGSGFGVFTLFGSKNNQRIEKWEHFFGKGNKKGELLLKSGLLQKIEGGYTWRHLSIYEFLIIEAMRQEAVIGKESKIKNNGKQLQQQQQEENDNNNENENNDDDLLINKRLIVNNKGMLDFSVDLIRTMKGFKEKIWEYIYSSRKDVKKEISSANGITILNRARINFSGMDLSGLRIQEANLSTGLFDSTNFTGSDLRGVNFEGSWLKSAIFNKSMMEHVKFGEKANINAGSTVLCISYNNTGDTLATGCEDGALKLWDLKTGKLKNTFRIDNSSITSISYSPDGKTIATCCLCDQIVKLWDSDTGKFKAELKGPNYKKFQLFKPFPMDYPTSNHSRARVVLRKKSNNLGDSKATRLTGHTKWVNCLAYSPDGKTIATGSNDETIKLWNADNGELKKTLAGHTQCVNCLAYSPDGKTIATGSNDDTIKLWNADNGELKKTWRGHTKWVTCLVYSADGGILATASQDQTIKIWNSQTGKLRATYIKVHTKEVNRLIFSPDGKTLASCSKDHTINLWDTERSKLKDSLKIHSGNVKDMALCPDGKTIATCGSIDQTVKFSTFETSELKTTRKGHKGIINMITYRPDGKEIATCSDDKTIKLWDLKTGLLKTTFVKEHTKEINSLIYSPDGKTLASCSKDNIVNLWDTEAYELKIKLNYENKFNTETCMQYSPDGKTIAIFSPADNQILLWDLATCELNAILKGDLGIVKCLTYSPDGKSIATGGEDMKVAIWDLATLEIKATLIGHKGAISNILYSPDGETIATASYDWKVKLWDTKTYKLKTTILAHKCEVISISYSPNGKTLASASSTRTMKLWDTNTYKLKATLNYYNKLNLGTCIEYSPNGKTIATNTFLNTVEIWDTETFKLRASLKGHLGIVTCFTFSPDGNTIATVCQDHTIRVWDLQPLLAQGKEPKILYILGTLSLFLDGAQINGTKGLSRENYQLLVQSAPEQKKTKNTEFIVNQNLEENKIVIGNEMSKQENVSDLQRHELLNVLQDVNKQKIMHLRILFNEKKYEEMEQRCTRLFNEEFEISRVELLIKRAEARIMLKKIKEANDDLNFASGLCEIQSKEYKTIQGHIQFIQHNYEEAFNFYNSCSWIDIIVSIFLGLIYQETLKLTNTEFRWTHEKERYLRKYFKYNKIIKSENRYLQSNNLGFTDIAFSLNNRGEAYLELEDVENAKQDFEMALQMCHERFFIYPLIMGNLYRAQGKYEKAMFKYVNAIIAIPEEETKINGFIQLCKQALKDPENDRINFNAKELFKK
ncbi:wd repeat-containing protein wdr-5.2-related [Anaeramoeba flamelloides]|uniref:Wd repeat-containing protein wdr-5.2-related n=1 Tax=Anaeramoeba flamelloides TaxID=1746091 RepID=A0AAV7YJ78_9EUKA|nr:wd repeat-containing protein wdr-5.2-related [Anaeramoeba flamelloides]